MSIGAPVVEGCDVTALDRDPSTSDLVLATSSGEVRARNVVVATGPFQRPAIPAFSRDLPKQVLQLDPTRYRRPEDLPAGAVLVVGSGASGAQIAEDLLRTGRTVFLSVSSHRRVPRRFRGRDFFWWLEKLGRFSQRVDELPGGRRPPGLLVTGVDGGHDLTIYGLAADGAVLAGHLGGVTDGWASFADDVAETLREADRAYDGIRCGGPGGGPRTRGGPHAGRGSDVGRRAAGSWPAVAEPRGGGGRDCRVGDWVRYAYDWLHLPVLDERGSPVQRRGVTAQPGLYFLGLHWMHTLRSGLLMGVGDDARFLAEQIERRG